MTRASFPYVSTFCFALLACGAEKTTDTGTTSDSPTTSTSTPPTGTEPEADADQDGIVASEDCDDQDPTLLAIADDNDCDGVLSAADCDDSDAALGPTAEDADCDGLRTADDCDDADPKANPVADDQDCDGARTADDCDDADPASLTHAEDGDCDGWLTLEDCNDTDPAAHPGAPEIPGNGGDENCDTVDGGDLVLNEVHFDPASGTILAPGESGDANFDGVRDAQADEFVEIVNASPFTVDVGGFTLWDSENLGGAVPNHVVPAGTLLAAGQALVVFGGGTPGVDAAGAVTTTFGGAVVQTASFGELNLNNADDILTVRDAFGADVFLFELEPLPDNNPDESYTRSPDLTGDFVVHGVALSGALYSPGTQADGGPFVLP